MVVEYHSNGTATEEDNNNSHPRYLSASLCCIWEQPAVVLPPPPPPRTTVFVRPPESRRPRCLADRASWAGFSSNAPIAPGVARGRSNVLMGTQVLHQSPGTNPLYGTRDLPQASSTPIHPQSQQNDVDDRLDPPVGHPPHPVAFAMDVRKHGRRRSRELGAGRQSQLRSPAVARPPTARVTLQGWLHKQGSEGLMLWKRRWFVLSEYCLFYYKGPEEEKLLGSILLPSYKVSPCAPDDRVFRKFCFKAEHQNMRTYFFAADSRELMVRWMNALSLASILQTAPTSAWIDTESGRPSVSSISQSADDSDSGFHGYRSPRGATTAVTPRQGGDGSAQPPPSTSVIKDLAQSGTLPNSEANGWPPRLQPLYANAPPKPRRLNSQHGDSPDPSPDRAGSHQTPPPAQTKESDYGSQQQQLVTPPRGYGGPPNRAPYHFHPQVNGPTERRTPDTYGRSNNVSRADYEDVYGDRYGTREGWPPPPPQAYMTEGYGKGILQPGQPYPVEPAYIKNTPPQQQQIYQVDPNYVTKNQTPQGFTPEGTYAKGVYVKPAGPARLEYNPITPPTTLIKQPLPYPTFRMSSPAPTVLSVAPAVQPRPKPPSGHPPRPHSADFLEKDTRYIPETSGSVVMRRDRSGPMTERPKSSVDMYHDYWSEESYAQKMRQSLYLHAHAQPGRANTPQQRPADARLRPPSVERIDRGRTPQLSPQSPANTTPRRYDEQQQQNANSARRYSEQAERNANSNLFMRSASARLPRQRASSREEAEQQEMSGGSERKIQQREESMQRLLEWKQRMLQSPLTRKSSPRPHDAGAAPSPLSHLLLRGAQDAPPTPGSDAGSVSLRPRRQTSRGASSSSTSRSRSQDPGRRSAPPPHRRNSYSSDDEGSGSGSVRDSLPASRSNGNRHQQRTSPMAVQPPSQAASNTPLQGSLTGGGGGTFTTGAGPGSRGASPQRLLNGGGGGQHSGGLPGGLLSVGDQPDESTNTSDSELIRKPPPPPPPGPGGGSWSLNSVSAGDLLGRTHEELVLLLIQLRRESAALRHAAELCRADALSQARLAELDASRRAEHLRRLEELKRHLQEIEKQYEKGKPLVHLVDNMVKLGSLYRGPSPHSLPRHTSATPPPIQRLEFNLQVQEQRLLAEERREWNRLSPPDHSELQAKVQQLYRLDRLLQEESVTIQSLQQDKALLERALGGLRHKLAGSAGAEAERYRRQQRLLERELSRIRHLLAANSKKLEETVAENARLEHELVLLRQKLQASRRVDRSSSPATVNAMGGSSTAALEMELRRVQSLVGDLQRQRHDLSAQVRQLTEKSQCLAQQIRPGPTGGEEAAVSSRRRHSSASSNKHRRPSSSWLETDLDSLHTQDVGLNDSAASPPRPPPPQDPRAPLYVNTDALEVSGYLTASRSEDTGTSEELSPPPPPAPESAHSTLNGDMSEMYEPQDISEADDRMKRFYGIIPRAEKPEIKTVRIVKRESERRNRVKRPNTLDGDLIRVMEEDPPQPPPPSELELSLLLELQAQHEEPDPSVLFQRSLSLPRGFGKQPPPPPPMRAPSPRSESGTLRAYASRYRPPSPDDRSVSLSAHAQLFGMDVEHVTAAVAVADEDICLAEGSSSSGPVSPVYQSEAARAIVQEMTRRRSVPRTKRRHHTVAGRLQPILGVAPSPTGAGARARDDLDMERALRRRVAGAPDVVRSTLSQRELKYNETTIDSILGTPNKILIPERYVPEQEPEMSAEEQLQRLKKAESIRKMLSETTPIAPETQPPSRSGEASEDEGSTMKLKLAADKRQREHLLHLNQLLAQQVMEKSKMVAGSSNLGSPRE